MTASKMSSTRMSPSDGTVVGTGRVPLQSLADGHNLFFE
jgi:hypothetical protein